MEVEIAEHPEDAPLLAGYSADVEIIVERREDFSPTPGVEPVGLKPGLPVILTEIHDHLTIPRIECGAGSGRLVPGVPPGTTAAE